MEKNNRYNKNSNLLQINNRNKSLTKTKNKANSLYENKINQEKYLFK